MRIPEMKPRQSVQESESVLIERLERTNKFPKTMTVDDPPRLMTWRQIREQRKKQKAEKKISQDSDPHKVRILGKIFVKPKGLSETKIAEWVNKTQKKLKRRRDKNSRRASRKRNRQFLSPVTTKKPVFSEHYITYMKSNDWSLKRDEAFSVHGRQCNRCGGFKKLQCHHLTYERFGNEDVKTDIEILCRSCHEAEHGRKF